MLKAIKELTPQKLTIYLLGSAIVALWLKLQTLEEKGDGKTEKTEVRTDLLRHKIDSIQDLRIREKEVCKQEIAEKENEIKDFLRQALKEQKDVKTSVSRVEKSAENLIRQTKKQLAQQQ